VEKERIVKGGNGGRISRKAFGRRKNNHDYLVKNTLRGRLAEEEDLGDLRGKRLSKEGKGKLLPGTGDQSRREGRGKSSRKLLSIRDH